MAGNETVSVSIDFKLSGQESVDQYTRAIRALDGLKASGLSAYEVAVKKVEAVTKSGQKTTETYTVKIKDAAKVQAEAVAAVRAAEIAYQKYSNALRKSGQDSDKLNQSQIKLAQNSQKLDQAQVRLFVSAQNIANAQARAEQSAVRLGLAENALAERIRKANEAAQESTRIFDASQKTFNQIGAGLQQSGQQIENFGKALTVGVTLPLAGAGVASVKFAGDLQSALAEISTIAPQIDTKLLEKQLNDLSTRVPQSANDLAASVYNIFSSIDVDQTGAVNLAEQFAKGATAAKTDVDSFGTAILGVLNAYKLDVSEAAKVSDIFFNTVNKGVVNGQELAGNLGVVVQSAKNAGVSFEELGGFIAGVTKEGGPAAQNINNLANLFQKIVTSESQTDLNKLGIKTIIESTGELRPTIDVLTDLKAKLDTLSSGDRAKALQEIFPDAQARTGAQTIISQLDFVRQTIKLNGEEAGSTAAAYAKMAATGNAQFKLLANAATVALTAIGDNLLSLIEPVVNGLAEGIVQLTAYFNNLSPEVKALIGVIAGIAAATGPVLVVIGGIIAAIGGLTIGITAIAASASTIGIVLAVIAGLFVALIPPIIATGAAIAALATLWNKNIGGIQEKALQAFGAIRQFIGATLNQIQSEFANILPQLQKLTASTLDAIQKFWDLHGERIVAIVKIAFKVITTVIETAITFIGETIRLVLAVINGDWQTAWGAARNIVENAQKAILTVLGALVRLVIEAIQGLLTQIVSLNDRFVATAVSLGKSFLNGLVSAVSDPGAFIVALVNMAQTAVNNAANDFLAAGQRAASYFSAGYSSGTANIQPQQFDSRAGEEYALPGQGGVNRSAPVTTPVPAPTRTKLPAGFGKNKRGGGAGKQVNFEPLDAAALAKSEKLFKQRERGIKIEEEYIERLHELTRIYGHEYADALDVTVISLSDYYAELRRLSDTDFDNRIGKANEELERQQSILAKISTTRRTKDNGDQLDRDLDKRRADITNLEAEIESLTVDKAAARTAINRKEKDSVIDLAQAVEDLKDKNLELKGDQFNTDSYRLSRDFTAAATQNTLELAGARRQSALAEADFAKAKSDSEADANDETKKSLDAAQKIVDLYNEQIKKLGERAILLEENNTIEKDILAVNYNLKQANVTADVFSDKLSEIGRRAEENSTDELTVLRERRAAADAYAASLDPVIARLKTLAKVLDPNGTNTDLQKQITDLENKRAGARSKPFSETFTEARDPFDQALRRRDQQLSSIDSSNDSQFQKDQQRLDVIRQTTDALLKQVDALILLAQTANNGQGDQNLLESLRQQKDAILQNAQEIQTTLGKVKNTAIDAFASGFTNFLQTVATDFSKAGQAALDFAGSFAQAVQQIIIQALALAAVKAILKAFGVGFAGGGSFSGASGGTSPTSAATGGYFADLSKYASGGAFQLNPQGLLSGPGTQASDEILARVSNKEYIFDGETTRNMGADLLDRIRAAKGRVTVGFAEGGAFSGISSAPGVGAATTNAPGKNELHLTNISAIARGDIEDIVEEVMGSGRGHNLIVNGIRARQSTTKSILQIG